eukprot:CAMPEP_0206312118 /NCGR_PEP_ID=MMETSP0106_2-20121207/13821_1 /ASSEMBLY_ACC=CAM_ASM_000206 /TAXON_ID=81532 /ORGANISM="Acanthoeca-like sp., Strain 10tr" /LENGTH=522 /DNA_ID=CAMNT_0053743401 /DNA_START=12 /DNA_END=1580 /DNA_ORIENTATION=+
MVARGANGIFGPLVKGTDVSTGSSNGSVLYEPSGVCRPMYSNSNVPSWHQMISCTSTTSAVVQTFGQLDSTCCGTPTQSISIQVPSVNGGTRFECELGNYSGHLVETSHPSGTCDTTAVCDVSYLATGICMASLNQIVHPAANYTSMYAWLNGTLALYPTADCSGAPNYVLAGESCSTLAFSACGSGTPAHTKLSPPARAAPVGTANIIKKTIGVGPAAGFVTMEPDNVCLPSFEGPSDTRNEHYRISCGAPAGPIVQIFAASDTDCAGPAATSPLTLPFVTGGTTIECIAGSASGYLLTKAYSNATCNEASACEAFATATGLCMSFANPVSVGEGTAIGSSYAWLNGSIARYANSNCTGSPLFASQVLTCPASATGTCVSGAQAYERVMMIVAQPSSAFSEAPTAQPTAGPTASSAPTNQPTSRPTSAAPSLASATEAPSSVGAGSASSSSSSNRGLVIGVAVVGGVLVLATAAFAALKIGQSSPSHPAFSPVMGLQYETPNQSFQGYRDSAHAENDFFIS